MYEKCNDEDRHKKRKSFYKSLKNAGLEIEAEKNAQDVYFVKIHAPMDVIKKYCGIMRFKMPIKEEVIESSGDILDSKVALEVQQASQLFYEFSMEKDFL